MTDTAKDTRDWDDLYPNGRLVHYEGDDPEGFALEMLFEFGIDVHAIDGSTVSCWCGEDHPWSWDEGTCRIFGGRPFFIPAGLVEAVYGADRWPIGS